MSPMPSLNSGHKTNITSVETSITTAINSLNNPVDSWQQDARSVLERLRRDMAALTVLRNQ